MQPLGDVLPLRPLSLGELFDRAVTIYVRNAWLFLGIGLVIALVNAALVFPFEMHGNAFLGHLGTILAHPGSPQARRLSAQFSADAVPMVITGFVQFLLLQPLLYQACAIGVAARYRGEPATLVGCLRSAFSRWPRGVAMALLVTLATLVWYAGFVIVAVVAILAVVWAFHVLPILGIVTGVLAVIVALALLLVLPLELLAGAYALCTMTLEDGGVFAALGRGFARVFARDQWWRAILLTLAWGVLQSVISIGGLGMIALVVASKVATLPLEILINVLVTTLGGSFLPVLLSVYYFDLRIRRDGVDLAVGVARWS